MCKMGKEKKDKRKSRESVGESKEDKWEEQLSRISPIANPLASRKLTKKIYKVVKKANQQKSLRKGVREVQKFVRKGEKGLVILAGDTSPVEVICHMPCVCEDKEIKYCYIPSKEDLGAACGSKRPTCMVMIKQHEDYEDLYSEVKDDVQALPMPLG